MKFRPIVAAASAAAGLFVASAASAAVYASYDSLLSGGSLIDFEDLADGTLVDTQYAGVTFGQTPGGRPQADEFPALFGYGASSGDTVLTGSTEGGNTFDTIAGLTIAFDEGQGGVEFFFSDTAPLGNYPIVFYGFGGSVLATYTLLSTDILPPGYAGGLFPNPATVPKPGIYIGYTSASANIYGIGIGPSRAANDSFAIDDLQFTTAVVPEPGTWAMMLLGFGGAGALLRRRRSLATV